MRLHPAIATAATSLTTALVCLGLVLGGNVLPSRSLVETQQAPIQEDIKESATPARRLAASPMHHQPPGRSTSGWVLVNDCAQGRIITPNCRLHAYAEQSDRNGVGGPLLC